MKEQIKRKNIVAAIIVLILVIANVVQIFIPFLKYTGTIEVGGTTIGIMPVKLSIFDILKGGNVEVLSSINSNISTSISIESLWINSHYYSLTFILIIIVGINLLISLCLIAIKTITKSANKHHMFYFNSAWLVFIATCSILCMNEDGILVCGFPVIWAVIMGLINLVIDIAFGIQITEIQKLAVVEYMNQFKNKDPELQISILESFQNCVMKARWADISDIIESTGDKEISLYAHLAEKQEQEESDNKDSTDNQNEIK